MTMYSVNIIILVFDQNVIRRGTFFLTANDTNENDMHYKKRFSMEPQKK